MTFSLLASLLPPLAPCASQSTTTGGPVWSYPAGLGQSTVTLGERGGQVFVSKATTVVQLLSSFDSNPPTPAWEGYPGGSDVAARDADTYLSLELVKVGASTSQVILYKRTSRSAVPDWTYSFVPQLLWFACAGISRDGRVIVTSFFDESTQRGEIRIHDPATGVPTRTFDLPPSIVPVRLALSPDGSVAAVTRYTTSGTETSVVDLATESVLFWTPGELPPRQGLSGGGGVFLVEEIVAGIAHLRVFVRVGGGYQEVVDSTIPYTLVPSSYVVSDDGSTIAFAGYEYSTPGGFIVRAFDVASATKTMERVFRMQNVQYWRCDLAINADGSRFVVGSSGQGTEPTLALYSPSDVEPLVEYPTGGAVISVDIAPDGDRFVASRYPVNSLSTSLIEMYEFGGEDLVVRGRPSIGSTVEFELHAMPGANAFLLSSPRLAATPLDIGGVGTLVLGRSLLESSSLGVVPPSGVATHSLALANDPALVGRTSWYQGLTTGPRRLSRDWIQLTILP